VLRTRLEEADVVAGDQPAGPLSGADEDASRAQTAAVGRGLPLAGVQIRRDLVAESLRLCGHDRRRLHGRRGQGSRARGAEQVAVGGHWHEFSGVVAAVHCRLGPLRIDRQEDRRRALLPQAISHLLASLARGHHASGRVLALLSGLGILSASVVSVRTLAGLRSKSIAGWHG